MCYVYSCSFTKTIDDSHLLDSICWNIDLNPATYLAAKLAGEMKNRRILAEF